MGVIGKVKKSLAIELPSPAQSWEEKTSGKISKNPFFSKNLKMLKKKREKNLKKKNAILLVLQIEEISLWPELSSPPRSIFQGGYPERDKQRRTEILVSNIG